MQTVVDKNGGHCAIQDEECIPLDLLAAADLRAQTYTDLCYCHKIVCCIEKGETAGTADIGGASGVSADTHTQGRARLFDG